MSVKITFSTPVKPEELSTAYARGMLRKKDLEDGAYYRGQARRTTVAMWSAKEDCFLYMRQKFSVRIVSRIRHPENDEGFDLFVPFEKIRPKKQELIKESA